MNAQVRTALVTQSPNTILGTPEKTLYYLVINTKNGQHIINIGKKTHDAIEELLKQEQPTTTNLAEQAKPKQQGK